MEENTETYELKEFVSFDKTDEFGKRHQRRRILRTIWTFLYNGVFGSFVTLVYFLRPFAFLLKTFMASAVIPAESINATLQIKNLIDKRKPWWLIGAVGLMLLMICATVISVDLFKFSMKSSATSAIVTKAAAMSGVKAAATGLASLGSFAALGPYIFCGVLSVLAVLNAIGLHKKRLAYVEAKQKGLVTPLKKFSLVNKTVKTTGLFILAAAIIPFMFGLGGPIVQAAILGVILAVGITFISMKIAKTLYENYQWKKTVEELKNAKDDNGDPLNLNPFKLLGMGTAEISEYNRRIAHKLNLTFREKLSSMWMGLKAALGVKGAQESLDAQKNNDPAEYINQMLENNLEGKDGATKLRMARVAELLSKPRAVKKHFPEYLQDQLPVTKVVRNESGLPKGKLTVKLSNGKTLEASAQEQRAGLMENMRGNVFYQVPKGKQKSTDKELYELYSVTHGAV